MRREDRGRARLWLPILYLAFALYMWIDFALAPRDGLANLGLFLATLPVALLGLLLGSVTAGSSFPLLPNGNGYFLDHAIYYVPAVLITALPFYALGRLIDHGRRRG
jgi:hypothetical protein